jgi:multidrug efflux pump subunit AcrB
MELSFATTSKWRLLGTAVLFGMLGVTCFGLLFTPAFYTFIGNLGGKDRLYG